MSNVIPPCRKISVFAFRGDRSLAFASNFLKVLDDEKKGYGPGPSAQDCLLFAGHAGVSTDGNKTIYGFQPDSAGIAAWELMDRLKNGDALPGVVGNDTGTFATAQSHGLTVLSFDIVLPDPQFQNFEVQLDSERKNSQYSYGFPNGEGDCNCITWLERLALPLFTGRMDEFVSTSGVVSQLSRRFGKCL
ncbi:MAG: hypothetical protein K8T91_07245 [Planctomycetes bacterium]|nr:hypothetical protein [Planctomycetota bacterium]